MKMRKTILVILIFTLVSKGLGFSRELLLSYYYGISNISDAYLISLLVPSTIFGFVVLGLTAGYIPIYSLAKENDNDEVALSFTNNIITFLIIINLVFCISTWIYTQEILKIFASGLEGETLKQAIIFLRITIFSILFTGIIGIISGYLQIYKMQIITAAIGIPLNITILLSIKISAEYSNIYFLPLGYVIGTISQFLFLIIFAWKKKFKYRLIIDFKDKYTKKIFKMSIPVILGLSVNQINVLVDTTLASKIMIGGVSSLTYANNLNLFVQGIIVLTIINIYYPIFSELAIKKEYKLLKEQINKTTEILIFCIFPFVLAFIFFSKEIITFLFSRGEFDEVAVKYTSEVLIFYSIGMIFFGLRELIIRAFYSIGNSTIPMLNSIFAVIINIILNFTFYKKMGINGLAFATSLSAIITTLLLYYQFNSKVIRLNLSNSIFHLAKRFAISIIVISGLKLLLRFFDFNILFQILVVFLYFLLYALFNYKYILNLRK